MSKFISSRGFVVSSWVFIAALLGACEPEPAPAGLADLGRGCKQDDDCASGLCGWDVVALAQVCTASCATDSVTCPAGYECRPVADLAAPTGRCYVSVEDPPDQGPIGGEGGQGGQGGDGGQGGQGGDGGDGGDGGQGGEGGAIQPSCDERCERVVTCAQGEACRGVEEPAAGGIDCDVQCEVAEGAFADIDPGAGCDQVIDAYISAAPEFDAICNQCRPGMVDTGEQCVRGAADFVEVLQRSDDSVVTWLLNVDQGSWRRGTAESEVFVTGQTGRGVLMGDMDGDGFDEIIQVIQYDDSMDVAWVPNDGEAFRGDLEVRRLEIGQRGRTVLVGDMNGDGFDDFVQVIQYDDGIDVTWQLNDGNGEFAPHVPARRLPIGQAPRRVLLADLNGDGFDEVIEIIPDAGGSRIAWAFNDRAGQFDGELQVVVPPFEAENIVIGDMNADGLDEFVRVALFEGDPVTFFFPNTGDGRWNEAIHSSGIIDVCRAGTVCLLGNVRQ